MDYNTTAVNSCWNMYPTACPSNSSRTPSFLSIVELKYATFYSGFNTRITVAKETSEPYAMPIHIPSKRNNEDLPKSVELEFVDRFRGQS